MQSPFARWGRLCLQFTQVISAIGFVSRLGWDFVGVVAPASLDLLKLHLKAGVAQVNEVIIEAFEAFLAAAMPGVFDDELLHQQWHEAVDIIGVDAEGDNSSSEHDGAEIFGVASLRSIIAVGIALLEVF